MLSKHKTITDIIDTGIVAIIRTDHSEQAKDIVNACLEGGLTAIEITFTVNGAHHILENLVSKHSQCLLGAGTVLDAATARIAILSGASYVVAPSFDVETAKLCNRYAIPYLAGCYTPTEIAHALDYGVDIVKLFPGSFLSPTSIKTLKGPFPQLNIMPTGGITIDNARDWIKAGAVALGIGGDLVAGAKTGDYVQITKKAMEYKKVIDAARKEL